MSTTSFLYNVKLAIFDLDGTLYENVDHFNYYASLIKKKLPSEKKELFYEDYKKMVEGEHPVSIGKVYDAKRDRVLTIDPKTNHVTLVQNWKGEELSEQNTHYTEALTYDFESMIAIGDGWWLPVAAAKHYGVESTYEEYQATKEFMQTKKFQFKTIPHLRTVLMNMKKTMDLVLVTNSDHQDTLRILASVNIEDVFDELVTSANKPTKTGEVFQHLLQQYHCSAAQAVSIGDNYLNDIAPAERLGMKGLLIQPTSVPTYEGNIWTIPSLSTFFKKMGAVKRSEDR